MARWVKSKQQMNVFKTSTTPGTSDGLKVGDIWVDTTSGAVAKVCTSLVGPTFSTVPILDNPTFTTGITTPKITFNSTSGVIGTTTNNSAAAGSVGEIISSVLNGASSISLTTTTAANVTSISLTAGDWDVWGNLNFVTGATTNVTYEAGWISSSSALLPDRALFANFPEAAAGTVYASNTLGYVVPMLRFSLSGTTTIYLSAQAAFTVSTLSVCGGIYARRRR